MIMQEYDIKLINMIFHDLPKQFGSWINHEERNEAREKEEK